MMMFLKFSTIQSLTQSESIKSSVEPTLELGSLLNLEVKDEMTLGNSMSILLLNKNDEKNLVEEIALVASRTSCFAFLHVMIDNACKILWCNNID